jgi:2,3-bisphosphoglycerate-independent phosphoglycerate mutase
VNSLAQRILLVFIDGIGIGPADRSTNPFATASLPSLSTLLDGARPVREALDPDGAIRARHATLVAADATLGVQGRPQSGTGQTALLTGHNAARIYGRHFGSWVPTGLRSLLSSENLLTRAVRAGRAAAFANAHPPTVRLDRRPNAPALAADSAGLLTRGAAELAAGHAVASSITNDRWIEHLGDDGIPHASPADAGRTLARIARGADLTLFAHYDTDHVGHRGSLADGVRALERVDAFLGALLAELEADTLVLVASDHGNLEELTSGHTRNPVPVLATGPGHAAVGRVRAITHVAPLIAELLRLPQTEPT